MPKGLGYAVGKMGKAASRGAMAGGLSGGSFGRAARKIASKVLIEKKKKKAKKAGFSSFLKKNYGSVVSKTEMRKARLEWKSKLKSR